VGGKSRIVFDQHLVAGGDVFFDGFRGGGNPGLAIACLARNPNAHRLLQIEKIESLIYTP
jgi:hypothetical protein